MQLEVGKFYKTNHGYKAECLSINYVRDLGEDPAALILVRREGTSDVLYTVHQDGSIIEDTTQVVSEWGNLDIIRSLPVDTKILVRQWERDAWRPRHFSHVSDNGKIHVWAAGTTSWTAADINNRITTTTPWNEAKLPDER